MSSVLRTLQIPYHCVLRLLSDSKTQKDISPSQTSNVFQSILSPFETYVVSLQSLLIWERPYLSAGALLSVNILYWLIVSWNRRFFSILSIFSLCIFVHRTWVKKIWPEIKVPLPEGEDTESWITVHPDVLSVPELSQYLNDFLSKMILLYEDIWKLRKENRGLFCCLMCGFFSLTAFMGKMFPGVLIIYFFVLLMTLGPGVALHLIPSTVYDQIIGYFSESDSAVSRSTDKDSELEEFLPDISAELLRQLSLKDDSPDIPSPGRVLVDPLGYDESMDSYRSDEFYQGLNSFPSVEEEAEESDIEEDLDLSSSASHQMPAFDASLPHPQEMHFDPKHFKADSTSSSESDHFAEGLHFDEDSRGPSRESSVPPQEEDDLADFEVLEQGDVSP